MLEVKSIILEEESWLMSLGPRSQHFGSATVQVARPEYQPKVSILTIVELSPSSLK